MAKDGIWPSLAKYEHKCDMREERKSQIHHTLANSTCVWVWTATDVNRIGSEEQQQQRCKLNWIWGTSIATDFVEEEWD